MQNKIVRDVNFILTLLKERKDMFDVLFGNEDNGGGSPYVNPQSVYSCFYDYMYKTTWLFTIVNRIECSFGVIADGTIILHEENDAFIKEFCPSLQDFPAQRLLNFYIGDTKEEIDEYFKLPDFSFVGDWFDLLKEYVKICEDNDIQLHPVYQKLLRDDFSDKDFFPIACMDWPDGWLDGKDGPAYGEMVSVDGRAAIGQKCLPAIERELFKPVTRLYMPRLLHANEDYTEIPLVEHMVDGNDISGDETFIQE